MLKKNEWFNKTLYFIVMTVSLFCINTTANCQDGADSDQEIIQVQAKGIANIEQTSSNGVLVTDRALALKNAKENALQNAVQKALGIYVRSFEQVEAGRLVASRATSEYEGLIKDYFELSHSFTPDGICEIWLRVDVLKEKAFDKLKDEADATATLWRFTPTMIGNPTIYSESNNSEFKDYLDVELAKEGFTINNSNSTATIQIIAQISENFSTGTVKIINTKTESYIPNIYKLNADENREEDYHKLAKTIISQIYSDPRNFIKRVNLDIDGITLVELKEFKNTLTELTEIISFNDEGLSNRGESKISLVYSGYNTDSLVDSLKSKERCVSVLSYDQNSIKIIWEGLSDLPILKLDSFIIDYIDNDDRQRLLSFNDILLSQFKNQSSLLVKGSDWPGKSDYEVSGAVRSTMADNIKLFIANFTIRDINKNTNLSLPCEIKIDARQGVFELANQVSQSIFNCFRQKFFSTISLQSNLPSQAKLNGELAGSLPLTLEDLIPGNYQLCVVPDNSIDYMPFEKEYKVSAGQKRIDETIFFNKWKRKVFVTANVPNAEVYVNHAKAGIANKEGKYLLNLDKGIYDIRVTHEKYLEASREITVDDNNIYINDTLKFKLKPIPKYASIDIESFSFGEVRLNEESKGSFPGIIAKVEPGMVKLSLQRAGYNTKWDTTFLVNENEKITIVHNFGTLPIKEYGWLYIDSYPPFARIYMNDKDMGINTPGTIERITPGRHKISLDFFSGSNRDTTVVITRGDTLRIKINK